MGRMIGRGGGVDSHTENLTEVRKCNERVWRVLQEAWLGGGGGEGKQHAQVSEIGRDLKSLSTH